MEKRQGKRHSFQAWCETGRDLETVHADLQFLSYLLLLQPQKKQILQDTRLPIRNSTFPEGTLKIDVKMLPGDF